MVALAVPPPSQMASRPNRPCKLSDSVTQVSCFCCLTLLSSGPTFKKPAWRRRSSCTRVVINLAPVPAGRHMASACVTGRSSFDFHTCDTSEAAKRMPSCLCFQSSCLRHALNGKSDRPPDYRFMKAPELRQWVAESIRGLCVVQGCRPSVW